MSDSSDVLHQFQLQSVGIRGGFVRLESTWAAIREHADYPPAVMRLLGEAATASALFAGSIKFEGSLSIHLRGAGDLRLLFAECTHDGRLRGVARWEGDSDVAAIELAQPSTQLAITIENTQTSTRYQSLVAVDSSTLASAFEGYFERSEQLPTRVLLIESAGRCAGLMVQHVPAEGGVDARRDDDAWNRVGHLLATISASDLLDLAPEVLLHRVFHDEGLRLDSPRPLGFECSCSHDRVVGMLRALGREESEAALAENGVMSVTCEFCNHLYAFDRVDLALVFATATSAPGSTTAQ
ncbi:MAG: Hsp33 family molecular chaperone HslO [Dokdonella sp.]